MFFKPLLFIFLDFILERQTLFVFNHYDLQKCIYSVKRTKNHDYKFVFSFILDDRLNGDESDFDVYTFGSFGEKNIRLNL